MRTLLFTGATGYLGSNILKTIINKYDKIIILKRSFSNTFRINKYLDQVIFYNINEIDVEKVFLEHKIDLILHCATDYGRKNVNRLHIIESNLILPIKLLEYGVKNGVKCFINTDTILDKRISYYSLSKKQFKDWLMSFKDQMVCISVALEHFFGPGDDKTKFVSFIVDNLINGVEKIDLTLGEQERDFIYVEDAVEAFNKIFKYSEILTNGFYEYQIGSENVVSIKDFVSLIKKLVNNKTTKLNFGALPYRENEIMKCSVDTSEIRKLGWKANYSTEEGLKKMIDQELLNLNIRI